MCEFKIQEDRHKLFIYTLLLLILTIALLILASGFYSMQAFLFTFLMISGMWFSVKAMCRYGKKWLHHTPVVEFTNDEIILHTFDEQRIPYQDIKDVKLIRDYKSVKLFFATDYVSHPSGWYYVGAIYLFQRATLKDVEKETIACLKNHHIEVHNVEKA